MAPILARAMRLQPRAQLTMAGNILVISLVILGVSAIFCAVVTCLICKKQRRTKKEHKRLQEERAPFVTNQYLSPAPQNFGVVQTYNGPIELQGSTNEPQPVQQLDGYAAAVCARNL